MHCGSSVDITGQEFTALICQESDKVGAFFFSFCFLFFVLLLLFFKQILRGRGRRINLYLSRIGELQVLAAAGIMDLKIFI